MFLLKVIFTIQLKKLNAGPHFAQYSSRVGSVEFVGSIQQAQRKYNHRASHFSLHSDQRRVSCHQLVNNVSRNVFMRERLVGNFLSQKLTQRRPSLTDIVDQKFIRRTILQTVIVRGNLKSLHHRKVTFSKERNSYLSAILCMLSASFFQKHFVVFVRKVEWMSHCYTPQTHHCKQSNERVNTKDMTLCYIWALASLCLTIIKQTLTDTTIMLEISPSSW